MINELKIKNFKCVSELTFKFGTRINLLVGNNDTGKTTILQATRMAMSHYLQEMGVGYGEFLDFKDNDFRRMPPSVKKARWKKAQLHFDFPLFKGEIIGLPREKPVQKPSKGARGHPATDLKGNFPKGKSFQADYNGIPAPLLACYFINEGSGQPLVSAVKYKPGDPDRALGYNECLCTGHLTHFWLNRMLLTYKPGSSNTELTGVINTISAVFGRKGLDIFKGVRIDPKQNAVWFILSNGCESDYDSLSSGYRRMVDLVLDLSFRCMILNGGIHGLKATELTEGIVLIDDIDLHLNPKLQALILKTLVKSFPNLQMIISTHAPIIMSQVNARVDNSVHVIHRYGANDHTCCEYNMYGMNVSDIHELVMQTAGRGGEAAGDFNRLNDLYGANRIDEANTLLNELKAKYGENLLEIARIETMLMTFDEDIPGEGLDDDNLLDEYTFEILGRNRLLGN